MTGRGEVWWADLPEPVASDPGYRRPVLIIQSDDFNRSRIRTVVAAALTTNLRLARLATAPGNVLVAASDTGLRENSVVNVSQIITVDEALLSERIGRIGDHAMSAVEDGVRMLLAL